MNPVLVFGSNGQVGSNLLKLLETHAIGVDYPQVDFSNPDDLVSVLESIRPRAVINTAAYTQVDRAESEPVLVNRINAEAPGILARWCAKYSTPFVHYSTDYIFSGEGAHPWREDDPANPINKYGISKLLGERAVAEAGGRWLVFRTSWIYGATGVNFLRTMLKLGAEKETLKVVNDQHGSPTHAPALAKATLEALKKANCMEIFPSGIYHLTGSGVTTWYEFAQAIFEEARKRGLPLKLTKLTPVSSAEYPTPARRPKNSRMDNSKVREVFGITLPHWKTSLAECMLNFR